jgi:hypothetical protein
MRSVPGNGRAVGLYTKARRPPETVRGARTGKQEGPVGTAWIFSVRWEGAFRGFSYGFRPGRNPQHALDSLIGGIHRTRVNWLLDADIQAFFDQGSQAWLVPFVEYQMGDKRVVRRIQQGLKAGGCRVKRVSRRGAHQPRANKHLPPLCICPRGARLAEPSCTR